LWIAQYFFRVLKKTGIGLYIVAQRIALRVVGIQSFAKIIIFGVIDGVLGRNLIAQIYHVSGAHAHQSHLGPLVGGLVGGHMHHMVVGGLIGKET
jgi:hypothetical protein